MDLINVPKIIIPNREIKGVSFAQFYVDREPFFRYGLDSVRAIVGRSLDEEFDCPVLEEIVDGYGMRLVTGGADVFLAGAGQMNHLNGTTTLYGKSTEYPVELTPDKTHMNSFLPYLVSHGISTNFFINPQNSGKSRDQLAEELIELLREKYGGPSCQTNQ